jgi:hypothetical protein
MVLYIQYAFCKFEPNAERIGLFGVSPSSLLAAESNGFHDLKRHGFRSASHLAPAITRPQYHIPRLVMFSIKAPSGRKWLEF